MAVPELTSTHAELVALAKDKLAMPVFRAAEVDHLIGLLERGERVVTFCDALFRSGRQEWRGLIVLTDERLKRLDIIYQHFPMYFVTACAAKRQNLLANGPIHSAFKAFAVPAPNYGAVRSPIHKNGIMCGRTPFATSW